MHSSRAVAALAAIAWLAIAAAGALVVGAVFQPEGISIGGNACGGAGASQVCRHIDRELALADLGWFSWTTVVGGGLLVVAGIAGALVPRLRPMLGVVALAVALVGLLGAGHLDNRFCPGGETAGTCGRTDDEWGPVLRDPLLDLRAETRAELVGRPARPGGPAFEEGQTMETFRSRALDGFALMKKVVVSAVFLLSLVVAFAGSGRLCLRSWRPPPGAWSSWWPCGTTRTRAAKSWAARSCAVCLLPPRSDWP